MSNVFRGEAVVVLNGTSITLRPTFTAIAEIETATGKSPMQLAGAFNSGGLKTVELARVIHACHMAGPDKPKLTFEQVGELVMDEGWNGAAVDQIDGFLAQLIRGRAKEKPVKDPPANPPTTPSGSSSDE
jgi:hypothetical protein